MEITTRELRQLAADVDDQHHDAMATIHDRLAEVHRGETGRLLASSRRHFLRNAGLGGLALSVGTTLLPMGRLLPAAWAEGSISEGELAGFAQSVELAAVAAYEAAIDTGLLSGTVVDVAEVFRGHHQDHADALGGVASEDAVDEPNQALLAAASEQLQGATDEEAILALAQDLENSAAATYFYALGVLQDRDAALAAATILPVEGQHAVVLGQALGQELEEYVPTFQGSEGAWTPAEFPVNG